MKRLLVCLLFLIIPMQANAGIIRGTAKGVKVVGQGIAKGAKTVGKVSLGAAVIGTYEGSKFVGVNVAKGTKAFGKAAWKVIY
jgi:hypothetical protein